MSENEPEKKQPVVDGGNGEEEEEDSKIFPQRLMEILSNERFAEAICWLPHGRAFIIRNRKLFAETVMPKYFSRKAKYSSFTRKLNRWNFVRVSSGPELGAYYHEFFLRDKPYLAAQMFCKNARTMLAMANDTPKPAPPAKKSSSTADELSASSRSNQTPSLSVETVSSPVAAAAVASAVPPVASAAAVAAAAAVPERTPSVASVAAAAGPTLPALPHFPTSDLSPLLLAALSKQPQGPENIYYKSGPPSTQLQLLEQQIQIMQQEAANRLLMEHAISVSMREQQRQQAIAASREAQLLRQLMDLRLQKKKTTVPKNHRANAA